MAGPAGPRNSAATVNIAILCLATLTIGLIIIAVSGREVEPWESLAVPLTLVFGLLADWAGVVPRELPATDVVGRVPQPPSSGMSGSRKWRSKNRLPPPAESGEFQRPTEVHVTKTPVPPRANNRMQPSPRRGAMDRVFPLHRVVFGAMVAVPIGAILFVLVSANVAILFSATTMGYFVAHQWMLILAAVVRNALGIGKRP